MFDTLRKFLGQATKSQRQANGPARLRNIIRGTFEKLEERQVLAYQSIGTYIVPVQNGNWNTATTGSSPIFLEDGAEYQVTASGFAQMATGPQRLADAEYYQVRNSNGTVGPWEDMSLAPGATHNLGVRLKAANATEQFFARWHDSYLPTMDHTYTRTIIGTGANLQTKFVDSNYADNANNQSNKLKVEVFGKIAGDLDFVDPLVAEVLEEVPGASILRGQVGKINISGLRHFNASGTFQLSYDPNVISIYRDPELNQEFLSDQDTLTTTTTLYAVASTTGDTNIWLKWVPANGESEELDKVNLTIVAPFVDIDGDSNNDGVIDLDNVNGFDDLIEEDAPGVIINLNENNLAEIKLAHNAPIVQNLQYELVLKNNSSNIKIYTAANKTGLINFLNGEHRWIINNTTNIPTAVWIEGTAPGATTLELQLYQQGGSTVAIDKIKVGVYAVNLIIDTQNEVDESNIGAFVWLNSDFTKQTAAAAQTESGITQYIPDYAAPSTQIDPNYLAEFTTATLVIPPEWLYGYEFKLSYDSSKIRIWSDFSMEGMVSAGNGWFQIPADMAIKPISANMTIYIEGLKRTATSQDISLTVYNTENNHFLTDYAKYSVVDVNIAVDGDRNNAINYYNSYDKQLTFWYNNDSEGSAIEGGAFYLAEDVTRVIADNSNNTLDNTRDLEDFSRLNLFADPLLVQTFNATVGAVTAASQIAYKLSSNEQVLKLYGAPSNIPHTANAHVHDANNGIQQLTSQFNSRIATLGSAYLADVFDGNNEFLFEAIGSGAQTVTLKLETEFQYANGFAKTRQHTIELNLRDFTEFYTRYEIPYPNNLRQDTSFSTYGNASLLHAWKTDTTPFLSGTDRTILVHGWNMEAGTGKDWKRAFAETAFKRLYWQGYRGEMVEFDWPDFADIEGPRTPELLNFTLNMSEFQAWRSGQALMNLIAADHNDKTHLLAHSQGNIVAAEALRLWSKQSAGPLVTNYIAMQGAISDGAYGANDARAFDPNFPDYYLNATLWGVDTDPLIDDIVASLVPNLQSNRDLLRYFPDGSALPTSTSYMTGTTTAATKWINMFNPHDLAVSFGLELNNALTKSDFYLNANPGPELESNALATYVRNVSGYAGNVQAGILLPPPQLWPYRYVTEIDAQNVRHYYRVPYTVEGQFDQNRNTWTDLTPGLLNAAGGPGASAYEILAFMSMASADAIGNDASAAFAVNLDISTPPFKMQLTTTGTDSASYRFNHSFQYHHSAATTYAFWNSVKTQTVFTASY